ncbi:glycoside hydrolase family 5 protein [Chitinophaga rhizophila]|uniref:Glycoside hydrolase family 5 protein n=1 Tax=Chitinophaga rhizophila TaxID=2866212 RepID=A0ABS7GB37_9BACT|nr:glycoside hydrolase family 5 protein [Chitinophaga rhizophila]MBW8684881.1 glycoside hydrolase family 5 protein [Chitinophaga rhizophila]
MLKIYKLPVIALLVSLMAFPSATVFAQTQRMPEGFDIHKGVNISHWLSQSGGRKGIAQADYITEKDIALLAEKGFDHIRIPVEEAELWDYKDEKYKEAFNLLHRAIVWCKQYHMRAIVDMHILRSHHFDGKNNRLWGESASQERFLQCWRELSAELKKYPTNLVAYELLNEPVADSAAQWNELLGKGVALIRELEPRRVIVVGSNRYQSVASFPLLKVPTDDKRLILSFHYYSPFFFTHYKAGWTPHKDFGGAVQYPGPTITKKELAKEPATIRNLLAGSTDEYNEDVIRQQVMTAVKVAQKMKLPLYCGEWGCLNTVPRKDRLRWYRDVRKVLEDNNIAWSVWDYKGSFGIVDDKGDMDDKLVKTLVR